MAFLDENGVAQLWAAVKDRLAGAFDSVEFDVAEQAANLMSGDSIATAFGKLAKNYSSLLTSISDLNTTLGNRISEVNTNLTNQINTKLNKSDVLANYTTTATGKSLDASLGPSIKEKMDLADTLNTRVGKIEGRSVLYAWDTKTNPTYATWINDCASVVLPANSGRWLILGECSYQNYGGECTQLIQFVVDPDPSTVVRPAFRTTTTSGGGCCGWAYATNHGKDRKVSVGSYIYEQVLTQERKLNTVICAINLG